MGHDPAAGLRPRLPADDRLRGATDGRPPQSLARPPGGAAHAAATSRLGRRRRQPDGEGAGGRRNRKRNYDSNCSSKFSLI